MTTVAIVPETGRRGATRYRAISRLAQSTGATAGAALDALTRKLPKDQTGTIYVVQNMQADGLFPEQSRSRLEELMVRFHEYTDTGRQFPESDRSELGELVDEELDAAIARCAALAGDRAA